MCKSIKPQERECTVNNWLAAMVLSFSLINSVIGINGASLITTAVIILLCLLSIGRKEFIIYPLAVEIIAVVLIWFLISFCRVKDITSTFLYLLYFLAFGIISFVIGLQDICIDKVVAHMSRIGFAGIIVWLCRSRHLLGGFSSDDSPHLMGLAYAILPVLFSSVIGLGIDFKTRIISIINIALILYIYIKVAPRGVWLMIAFFGVIYYFYILSKIRNMKYRFFLKMITLSLAFLIIIIVLNNFNSIVLEINDFLSSKFGLSIYALEKFARYFRKGDVFNGRGDMWGDAIGYIQENFVLGKGIGYFEAQSGGAYIHNILLQAMCEGGIIVLVPIVLVILLSLKTIIGDFDKNNRNECLFFALTFLCGLMFLFYSSVYWINISFWFFLGLFLKKIYANIKNKSIRIKL